MNLHYDLPILLLRHMLCHEGYHHSQIKLALKLAGRTPATAGVSYAGKLAGRDGDAFMMRADDCRILIGRSGYIDPLSPEVGC